MGGGFYQIVYKVKNTTESDFIEREQHGLTLVNMTAPPIYLRSPNEKVAVINFKDKKVHDKNMKNKHSF